MADLNNIQSSGSTIIVGSDSFGLEQDPIGSTDGRLNVQDLPSRVSSLNSTSSTLLANNTFTGTWEESLDYSTITVSIFTSHDSASGGFKYQTSSDGTNWDDGDIYTIFSMSSGEGKVYSFGVTSQYFRVVYTNGGTNQTEFRLQTILHRNAIKNSSHRIDDPIEADDDAELVKATITGKADDGNYYNVAVDTQGRLVTSAITGFGADFSFGDVTTAAVTRVVVRRTTYTEQTTNAQRSIASSSANDTAAGTGARTILITYMDQTGAGPFTETITLNGTSYVNTIATNICFIERMDVVTAGSGGVNAGVLTLKATTAGGGATIGTVNTGDNQTFWSHHYVPTGKECNITGISCGHTGTTVGSGALFTLHYKPIGVANSVEIQLSDFIRLYGQSSTFSRTYPSPIKVSGPVKIQAYVTPETSTSTTYRNAFDFFEP